MLSAFIVIGSNKYTNNLVDGIIKSHPLNKNVPTIVSFGKLIEEEQDLYYEFTSTSGNHSEKEKTTNLLKDLIVNQISHTRKDASVHDELNIFLLENPYSPDDIKKAQLIYDSIIDIYNTNNDKNINLIRICFTYDLEHPYNVIPHIPVDLLTQKKQEIGTGEIRQSLFIIGNRNDKGAAICDNKEDHDLLMSRFLSDFMMLMSSIEGSYTIKNAIESSTKIFSAGYAEHFYFYEDLKNYAQLYYRHALLQYMLDNNNNRECEDLNIEKNPIGLKERVTRLEKKYKPIKFEDDINEFEESIDYSINRIIKELEITYKNIRQSEIIKGRNKDLKELKDSDNSKESNDFNDLDYIPDLIGQHERDALDEYPEYVDRDIIHQSWLLNKPGYDNILECPYTKPLVKDYEKILSLISEREFRILLGSNISISNNTTDPRVNNKEDDLSSNTGCLLSIFNFSQRKSKKELTAEDDMLAKKDETSRSNIETELSKDNIIKNLNKIIDLTHERSLFHIFKNEVNELQNKLEVYASDLQEFVLTSHSKSLNLIELEKLKQEFIQSREKDLSQIIMKWEDNPLNKTHTKNELIKTKDDFINDKLKDYKFIEWERPFSFLKSIDDNVSQLIDNLYELSYPFSYYNAIRDIDEDFTVIHLYSDNKIFEESVINKKVNVKANNLIQAATSKHIASKVCMFQINKIDDIAWDGIISYFSNL